MPTSKRSSARSATRRSQRSVRQTGATRQPTIKLYMRKINQEQIRSPGATADCTVYASWTKSCCILDFHKLSVAERAARPLNGLLLRSEPDGGMLWNPRSGAVYKLNEAAYHAVVDVELGLPETEVARRNKFSTKTTQNLFRTLRRIA